MRFNLFRKRFCRCSRAEGEEFKLGLLFVEKKNILLRFYFIKFAGLI
jgi:hypothetical protein